MDMQGGMPASLAAQMSSLMGKDQKKLLSLFKTLSKDNQQSVLDFVEFLACRDQENSVKEIKESLSEPAHEKAPEGESVIKAIKRLGRIYYMVDRGLLLNETSTLMTRHLMQGVPAAEIIVDLELLFKKTYESMREQK